MKNIYTLIIAVLALVVFATAAGADTLTETSITDYKGFSIHDFTYVMDSGGTNTEQISYDINGYIIAVETDPGTTAPTANYDMTITDEYGADVMGGALANRHTSTTEIAAPSLGYASKVPVTGNLTFNVTNQLVKNASVRILIYTTDEKKGVLSW